MNMVMEHGEKGRVLKYEEVPKCRQDNCDVRQINNQSTDDDARSLKNSAKQRGSRPSTIISDSTARKIAQELRELDLFILMEA